MNNKDITILVVDDDLNLINLCSHALRDEGYNVLIASSGEEAIKVFKDNTIDIIIIDYFMPGMNGEEAIRVIRELSSEVFIILQTGYAQQKPPIEMFKTLDIQGYHNKEYGFDNLLVWISAGVRICNQIRKIKSMNIKINESDGVINNLSNQNQKMLLEQARLISLGQALGSIFHTMSSPMFCLSAIINNIIKLVNNIDTSSEDEKDTKNKELHKTISQVNEYSNEAKNHLQFITELIDVVKEQSRQESITFSRNFSIDHVIKKTSFILRDELKVYRCILNVSIHVNRDIELFGKPINLVQVLNVLILNAAQAYKQNEGQNKIELKVSQNGDVVEFMVKDYAKGIPQNVQNKIFKEMITTKDQDASGIGLYTAYLIVTEHFNGDMWFESKKDIGTEFYISIPIAKKNRVVS